MVATTSGDTFPSPVAAASVNGTFYFSGTTTANGTELWKSDGTPAGTVQVLELSPGAQSSFPHNMIAIDNLLYFTAKDITDTYYLWITNGTPSGTVRLNQFSGKFGSTPMVLGQLGDEAIVSVTSNGKRVLRQIRIK